MKGKYFFTSESVSEGHPDKMADQISDAILDEYLMEDPESKVACECMLTAKTVIVAGEVYSNAKLTKRIPEIVREVIRDIGYNDLSGYDPDKLEIVNYMHEQSAEIRVSVEQGGAGDQGLMFGYACNDTPELMPYAISLAHRLMARQAELRKNGQLPWLLPDAKSQVTVVYDEGKIAGIYNIVLSTQHMPYINIPETIWTVGYKPQGHYSGLHALSSDFIFRHVTGQIIHPVIRNTLPTNNIIMLINPAGSFTVGGPVADTGLTGRKIIVDTYGGSCPHGGGAFSGKDPSKVDRSAAYMARYLAKNIVAAGIADKCIVQLSYVIGVIQPISVMIDFQGTGKVPEQEMLEYVKQNVDLSPYGIIERLQLKRPIYRKTATYGHFGRELPGFRWEMTDLSSHMATYFSSVINPHKTNQDMYNDFCSRFSGYSDQQLIDAFNHEVKIGGNGWGSARAAYMAALHNEFNQREFDYSAIGDKKALSFKNKIVLDGKTIRIIN